MIKEVPRELTKHPHNSQNLQLPVRGLHIIVHTDEHAWLLYGDPQKSNWAIFGHYHRKIMMTTFTLIESEREKGSFNFHNF